MMIGYLLIHFLINGIELFTFPIAGFVAASQASGTVAAVVYIVGNLLLWGGTLWGLYQIITQDKSGLAQRIYHSVNHIVKTSSPKTIAIFVIALVVIGFGVSMGTAIFLTRSIQVNEFGLLTLGRAYYGFGRSILLPLGLVLGVFWLNQQRMLLVK